MPVTSLKRVFVQMRNHTAHTNSNSWSSVQQVLIYLMTHLLHCHYELWQPEGSVRKETLVSKIQK